MATATATTSEARGRTRRPPLVYLGFAALAAIVAAWSWRAFHDPTAYDTDAAWTAGRIAWDTGRPEVLGSWTGLPSLAGGMALLSQVLGNEAAGRLVTVVNVLLAVGAGIVILRRLRPLLAPVWWWVLAFGMATYFPLMSTVWFKQFNLISLVLAAAGFELARRRRGVWAGTAIGISIAIKPMVILLPFVMLARRRTRRVGVLALGWVIALNLAAQALLAARGGQLELLDPTRGLRNLLDKTHPNLFLCHPVNFSPGSLLCRAVGGYQFWTLQRIAVWCLLILLGVWVVSALRGRSLLSWDAFAFICALSAMTSPFEWTHYQMMLAPLFIVLLYRFATEGAGTGAWLGLAVALALSSLIWQPYGTLGGTIRHLLTGRTETYSTLTSVPEVTFQEGIAQFAQYILIVTGALWYQASRRPGAVSEASRRPGAVSGVSSAETGA